MRRRRKTQGWIQTPGALELILGKRPFSLGSEKSCVEVMRTCRIRLGGKRLRNRAVRLHQVPVTQQVGRIVQRGRLCVT